MKAILVPLSSLAARRLRKLVKAHPDLTGADFLAWLAERALVREQSPAAGFQAVAFGIRRRSYFAVAEFLERTAAEQKVRERRAAR